MLAFLAPDKQRLPDLEQAMRLLLAWTSIVEDEINQKLNLDTFQRNQAETKRTEFEETVRARIQETWCWAMVSSQPDPQDRKIEWSASRLQGQDPLAVRASKKLVQEEALLTRMGPARLKLVLDEHLWQDADHLNTKKLWEYLASYLYLPRLRDSNVLVEAIQAGIGELVCDHFAYAGRYDEDAKRYEGLKLTGGGSVVIDSLSVVVKPEIAKAQQDAELAEKDAGGEETRPGDEGGDGAGRDDKQADIDVEKALPKRFFATVEVDANRAGRDVGKIAEEVLQHLTTLPGATVKVTVEIEAEAPDGVSEEVQRVVNENCQTLRFKSHGFEKS
jgi:hypothetical protein